MKIKTLFFVLILFISNSLIGQSLNEYKYVVVPSKFDFLKSENQYQLNDLTKFLFEKEGFVTIYDNLERPADLSNNACLGLSARVNNESNMFTTKLIIELVNCKNQKVLVSQEGRSKQKDYKKGYQEALREAFESVTAQNYNYTGTATVNSDNAVEEVRKAINKAVEEVVEEEPEVMEIIETSEDESTNEIGVTEIEEVVEEMKEEKTEVKKQVTGSSKILYAQANAMGYQLVDNTPKVLYILLNTSKKDVYLLKEKSGMIYKQNGTWFVEYYKQNELVKKPLTIKF